MPDIKIKPQGKELFAPKRKKKISKDALCEWGMGVLFAASSPYFGIAPFGMSFLTLKRSLSRRAVLSALSVILGSFLLGDKLMTAKYALAVFLYVLVLFVLERGVFLSGYAAKAAMSISLAAVEIGIGYIRGFGLDWLLTLVYETAGICLGAYAVERVKKIREEKRSPQSLSGSDKLCVLMFGAILFLSLKNFNFIRGFSTSNFAAALIILSSARCFGAGGTAIVGIALGGLCGIETDYFLPFIGAFGFCALATGIFAPRGKLWGIISFALADAVVIVYVNGAMREMLSIYEIIAAATVFFVLPDKLYERFGEILRVKNGEAELVKRIRKGVSQRLKAVSASFSSLGEALIRLSEKEEDKSGAEIAEVFDKTAEKVCVRCKKVDICWGKNFNSTYRSFFEVLPLIEKSGKAEEADMNLFFGAKCKNIPRLTAELNRQMDLFRVNTAWKRRLFESREAAAEQIAEVSGIINRLAKEINEEEEYDGKAAQNFRLMLENKGIKIKDISISKSRAEAFKIELNVRKCDWSPRGRGVIRAAAESLIGKDVNMCKIKENGEFVMIMIDESEKFEIEQGYASVTPSPKSGDSFRALKPSEGKLVITLSDGMGTGSRAEVESRAIVELIDSFLCAGFDKRVAIRLINSIMVLKSTNEEFATLDMCIIDLRTGEVEFVKTGAEPSFIKQNGRVETVSATSLPVGLMPEMEVETFERRLCEGDTIVMVTDGIASKREGSLWIKGFMENTEEISANELAEKVLSRAIEENNGKISDDMTVISLKVKKKTA